MTMRSNFKNFVDALTDELIAMPDEQLLEGCDASAIQSNALAVLKAARAEAGRRRLASAKAGVASLKAKAAASATPYPDVSVDEARQFLAQAQNDPRYTLAARKLGEMPEDEVLRLYRQLKQLEQGASDGGDDV